MSRSRRAGLLLVAATLLTGAACTAEPAAPTALASASADASPSASALPSETPHVPAAYEQLVRASRPVGYWPLGPDQVAPDPLAAPPTDGTSGAGGLVLEGAVRSVPGPVLDGTATTAAAFDGVGRAVSTLPPRLSARNAFSVELWVAPGPCNGSYGRIVGTEAYGPRGRDGLSFFHYPRQARAAVRCRLGIEMWHANRFEVGCPGVAPATAGRWTHLALTYSPGARPTCYVDGDAVRASGPRRAPYSFEQIAPFGLGGSGSGFGGSLATGAVAQVAVYDRPLSTVEIASRAKALQD